MYHKMELPLMYQNGCLPTNMKLNKEKFRWNKFLMIDIGLSMKPWRRLNMFLDKELNTKKLLDKNKWQSKNLPKTYTQLNILLNIILR